LANLYRYTEVMTDAYGDEVGLYKFNAVDP
jgi:hypothetical protein